MLHDRAYCAGCGGVFPRDDFTWELVSTDHGVREQATCKIHGTEAELDMYNAQSPEFDELSGLARDYKQAKATMDGCEERMAEIIDQLNESWGSDMTLGDYTG